MKFRANQEKCDHAFCRKLLVLCAGVLLAFGGQVGTYAGEAQPWSLDVAVGVGFDDDIKVSEIDNNAGAGDKLAAFDVSLGYDLVRCESGGLEVGYDFSQTYHETLSDFDFHSHGVSVFADKELDGIDYNAYAGYTRAYLGGRDFLGIAIIQPSVGRLFGEHWYLSATLGYQNKHLVTANDRDANQFSGEISGFYFFNESNSYFKAGYRIEDENAAAAAFDYRAHYFKFSYKSPVRLKFLPRDPIVRIGYEFAFKDYSSITGEIGEERLDKRHTVTAELELPISDHVGLQVEFERIGARSNLESSDFAQRIYAVSMLVSF